MLQKFSRRRFITALVGIAILGIGYFLFMRGGGPAYETIAVTRDTLIQEVSVTGTVTPARSANLAFERSGKVKGIYVDVGERVATGSVLAEIDNGELYGGVLDAEGNLQAEEARLAELKRGTRPEQIQVSRTKVASAESALEDAKRKLRDTIADGYTKSDDAIRNRADQFFTNPRGNSPQFNFTIADSQLKVNIEQGRYRIEGTLTTWQADVAEITAQEELSSSATLAKENLSAIKSFIDQVALAVNSLTPSGSLSQTTIDTYKASISTARTNINTAISNLSTSDEALRTANQTLVLAKDNLALDEAGSTPEQIAIQEARVEQAKAKVTTARAQLEKTIIRSPIGGIVTQKEAKVGEIVGVNQTVLAVISDQNLEIEVNVPETDIAKIKIDNTAKITLDAYSDDVSFTATVVSIDPAAKVIEGVPTYKATLYFNDTDPRIKSGMTANIDILTEERENVLFVPTRAVTTENNVKLVNLEKTGGIAEKVTIETGLRSSDGRTEILSGLAEGDKVIISPLP